MIESARYLFDLFRSALRVRAEKIRHDVMGDLERRAPVEIDYLLLELADVLDRLGGAPRRSLG